MSKADTLGQLKAVENKLDIVSSTLANSDWPAEEVDHLCDVLTESQVLVANVINSTMNHNCACTKEWEDEHTVIAEKSG